MKKASNPTGDYYRLLLYVLFLVELVLFAIAIIFGRIFGYDMTLQACFWLGIIVAGCFLVVVAFNLLFVLGHKIFQLIMNRRIH